jgi:ferredoxin
MIGIVSPGKESIAGLSNLPTASQGVNVMKTTIFYFTGTGNSLKIAKDIASQLGDTALVPVRKAIKETLDLSADRIGLVFPVYMWGMPSIITEFSRKIKTDRGKYVFAVATYGGTPGGTLLYLSRALEKQGARLSAGFGFKMPGNYIPLYGAQSDKIQKKDFEKAAEKVKRIVDIIRKGDSRKPETSGFPVNTLLSVVHAVSMPRIHQMDKSFTVLDKCTSCGICYKVCPVENIKLENGKPVWQGKCEQCMSCIQFCPVEAIQYGKKTEGKKRYHHPEIKLSELICR